MLVIHTCRFHVTAQELQHMNSMPSQANEEAQTSATLESATSLTPNEMQLVKMQQQIRAKQFAHQQSKVSTITSLHNTYVVASSLRSPGHTNNALIKLVM